MQPNGERKPVYGERKYTYLCMHAVRSCLPNEAYIDCYYDNFRIVDVCQPDLANYRIIQSVIKYQNDGDRKLERKGIEPCTFWDVEKPDYFRYLTREADDSGIIEFWDGNGWINPTPKAEIDWDKVYPPRKNWEYNPDGSLKRLPPPNLQRPVKSRGNGHWLYFGDLHCHENFRVAFPPSRAKGPPMIASFPFQNSNSS